MHRVTLTTTFFGDLFHFYPHKFLFYLYSQLLLFLISQLHSAHPPRATERSSTSCEGKYKTGSTSREENLSAGKSEPFASQVCHRAVNPGETSIDFLEKCAAKSGGSVPPCQGVMGALLSKCKPATIWRPGGA